MAFSLSRLAMLGATLLFLNPLLASEPAPATEPASQTLEPTLEDADSIIERGKYVAQLGDCIACHTDKKGAEMAGGLELKTPMGTIYSSNITPDQDTGIGRYTFEQFDRAMREGVSPAGYNLYPAMPYPSLSLIHI